VVHAKANSSDASVLLAVGTVNSKRKEKLSMAKARYTRKTPLTDFIEYDYDFVKALNANGVFTIDGLLSKPFGFYMSRPGLRMYWDSYVECTLRLFQLVRYDNFTL